MGLVTFSFYYLLYHTHKFTSNHKRGSEIVIISRKYYIQLEAHKINFGLGIL